MPGHTSTIAGWAFPGYAVCSDCLSNAEAEHAGGEPVFSTSDDANELTCDHCYHVLNCSVYGCQEPCGYAGE